MSKAQFSAIMLSIFPEMFPGPLGYSLAGKALEKGLWSLETIDIRQFATDKHRTIESCNGCHKVIDPPGFALESFDVIGGWRDRVRSLDKGDKVKADRFGQRVSYKFGPAVDASGEIVVPMIATQVNR